MLDQTYMHSLSDTIKIPKFQKLRPQKVDRGRGVQTVNQFSEANNDNKKSLKKLWFRNIHNF